MDSEELEDRDIFQRNISDRFADLLPDSSSSPPSDSPSSPSPGSASSSTSSSAARPSSRPSSSPVTTLPPSPGICNAVIHGIDTLRHAVSLTSIAVESLSCRPLSDGHVCRARKALVAQLTVLATEEKESSSAGSHRSTKQNWSSGSRGGGSGSRATSAGSVGQPKPWRVGKNWSATKQVQAMSMNLVALRGGESVGLAIPVHVMSVVVVFVMWVMVAAIPCQERNGLAMTLQLPKQVVWAQGMTGLVEKIGEE